MSVRRMLMILAALAVLAAGCGDDSGAPDAGGTDDAGDVILAVFVADEPVAQWTLADIESSFEFVTVVVGGDEETGPLVTDVLAASGVGEWSRAEVFGKGEGRSFDVVVEILAAEVDETWVLDITKRGTLKLASPELPKQEWVRDVREIRVP